MAPKPAAEQTDGIDIPDPANDAPEPIDVDLGEGAAAAEGADDDALPPKAAAEEDDEPLPPRPERRPGNRMPANKRINQLAGQVGTLSTERDALLAELESLRPKAAAADAETPQWRHATFVQAKRALTSDLNLLQHQLKAAKDAGSTEDEAKITTQISALSAEKQTVDNWLSQNKAPVAAEPAKVEPKPEPKPDARQRPPISEEAATWYAANPWAIRGHRDFDEEMADEAHDYAAKLEARLRRERRGDLIDSDWYYGRIMANQKAKFPDVDFGEEDLSDAPPAPRANGRAAVPPMTRARGVAPVTRSNGGAAQGANTVNLTSEERQMAHATPVGIINPITNKPWSVKGGSLKEREIAFAYNKREMLKQDKENPQRR